LWGGPGSFGADGRASHPIVGPALDGKRAVFSYNHATSHVAAVCAAALRFSDG
jgi:hypothetical protein